ADRYATAVAVSQAYEPGVPAAYVASGRDFPDALAAAARAGVLGGPVLLTGPDRVPDGVLAELGRLQPGEIVVLGGSGAVSDAVLAAVDEATDEVPVRRLGGPDRYATAVLLAQEAGAVEEVFIASGRDFP